MTNSQPSLLLIRTTILAAALTWCGAAQGQDHGHLYLSAYAKQPGAQLYFDNGNIFDVPSGHVKTLLLNTNSASRFFGLYDGNITVTPRSTNTSRGGDYGPNAAAPGAVIYFQITSVTGPAGGTFHFWESSGSTPALTVPVGSGATNLVKVSQSSGAPGEDPWGHIHGRRFTASKPGIYFVTFRALDLSTNGPGGGPIHTPSELLAIPFQAGFNIASIARSNAVTTIKMGMAATHDFTLQATTNVTDSNSWVNVTPKLRGTNFFRLMQDTNATKTARFYRVRVEPFVP